ncbi:MAG: PA2779 family protein [Gammaproteobacteria bacterium]|nr:PA2779 family protein [Gammaproteobacteria bacterium]
MKIYLRFSRTVSATVTVGILSLCLHLPSANAAMIGTEAVVQATQAQQDRSRIHEALNREEVGKKLSALGVDPAQVQARVAALTDTEAQQLAQKLDTMPAGGSVLGVVLTIFLVLLITDLLGWTDVFPFTNKGSAMP